AVDAVGAAGEVAITLAAAGPSAVIEVSDTGAGPPAEVAGRLFEPFVTGEPEGIGLGLTGARPPAQAHGRSVSWRRENQRTVFRVEVPIRTGVAAPAVR